LDHGTVVIFDGESARNRKRQADPLLWGRYFDIYSQSKELKSSISL